MKSCISKLKLLPSFFFHDAITDNRTPSSVQFSSANYHFGFSDFVLMYMTCLRSQTIHTYPVLKFGNHANLGKVKKESTLNDVIEGKGGLVLKDCFNLVPHSCKKWIPYAFELLYFQKQFPPLNMYVVSSV